MAALIHLHNKTPCSLFYEAEMFRGFMVLGSLVFIGGEMGLAWELHRIAIRQEEEGCPMWPLLLTTLLGTALSYPALPEGILFLSWILISAVLLYLIRCCLRSPSFSVSTPQMDSSLIPPLQTGIAYGLWSLFGLFADKEHEAFMTEVYFSVPDRNKSRSVTKAAGKRT